MPIICSARIVRCSIVGEALFCLRKLANFYANLSLNVLGPLLICINKMLLRIATRNTVGSGGINFAKTCVFIAVLCSGVNFPYEKCRSEKKIHFVSEHSLWIFMFANFQFKILSKKLILKYATRRLHVIYRRYVKQILPTRAVRIRSETNFPLWINWPIENIIMSQSERNE